ncbi:hypothetical protein SAMN05421771_0991 [Granulicella pectinivorans]|uniref:Uncharacterized protein n=1 Tax=Granulicella pectinivorans TaxID=474950 RepID=A0A1I6LMW6_9BACT|nr:hypothetical protein [Granulicella pectinivorans]SFS04867.1 hypothetical protein SAMN05421771_0991 [Granulicella pectinivorans]
MIQTVEQTTLLCLFRDDASASGTVHDLLELGVDESSIAVVGDARTALTGKISTETLAGIRVPDADLPHIMDGIVNGGTVVAVETTEPMTEQVDEIFRRHHPAISIEETTEVPEPAPSGFHPEPHVEILEEKNRLDMIESEENA